MQIEFTTMQWACNQRSRFTCKYPGQPGRCELAANCPLRKDDGPCIECVNFNKEMNQYSLKCMECKNYHPNLFERKINFGKKNILKYMNQP